MQSALSGVAATLSRLRAQGLCARVAVRKRVPFGPVMNGRAAWLEERGLILPGQRYEELVVIRAEHLPVPATTSGGPDPAVAVAARPKDDLV
ncbi:hypothetical protein [Nonomuraea sp. NPDC050540]|uniref:hypothetical protein n=1 Tax=Nonomuraea sp. NPDC050540 TaxID=3364367 RepID=UPI0037987CD6